mmetsp:Transcript_17604/g.30806  ORF Transcript_17604/g.30806 Transcript_17604/m.30806 type:complete len:201 (+) Transcript_17604:111-713(+)
MSTMGAIVPASVLMVMIFAVGPVSGAHFNPVVTICVTIFEGLKAKSAIKALIYFLAQAAGTLLAVFWVYAMSEFPARHHGSVEWDKRFSKLLAAEATGTLALVYVILNVAVIPKEGNNYFGAAIGFTVFGMASALAAFDPFGLFNPSVTLAVVCLGGRASWLELLAVVPQLMGGLLAVGLAKLNERAMHRKEISQPLLIH